MMTPAPWRRLLLTEPFHTHAHIKEPTALTALLKDIGRSPRTMPGACGLLSMAV